MPSEQTNIATRREWRELGFFYNRDDEAKQWRIVGSRSGLMRFCDEVAAFGESIRNEAPSEHIHLGPYMYLEIGSWPTSEITGHWIAGPISALLELANAMRANISAARDGDIIPMRAQYSPQSLYDLTLELRGDSFDPAQEDPACR